MRQLQHSLHATTVHAKRSQIAQHQVVVRAFRNDLHAVFFQSVNHRNHVLHDLLLVLDEFLRLRLLQSDGQTRDGVVVRPTLQSRENGKVNLLLVIVHDVFPRLLVHALLPFAVKDHRPSRTSQRFVRRRRDHVGVFKRRRDQFRGDQTGNVRHIRQHQRLGIVARLAHSRVIDLSRVRGRTGDDNLRSKRLRQLVQLLVIDQTRRFVQSVWHGVEVNGRGGNLLGVGLETVRQVTAVRQVQTHDSVPWVQQRRVHLKVRRRTRQGLNVHSPLVWVQMKRLQRSLLAQTLRHIDPFVPSVISRPRVPFRILIRHDRSERF